MDSQHLNSYKIDIFNIFIIRMLKIIFVLLFITFQSLAKIQENNCLPVIFWRIRN